MMEVKRFAYAHRFTIGLWAGALFTGALYHSLPQESSFVESYFSQSIYPSYRWVWDNTVARISIPLIYLWLGILTLLSMYRFGQSFRRGMKLLQHTLLLAYISFYWLWGFHYKRIPIFHQALPQTKINVDEDQLFTALQQAGDHLFALRQNLPIDSNWHAISLPTTTQYNEYLAQAFTQIKYPQHYYLRTQQLYAGSLLRIGTAGVYLPWVGQGHVDKGLHPISLPFTTLHEMAHGYGVTSEGDCNFLALLACVESTDAFVQYSGWFMYWRYLRSNASALNSKRFQQYKNQCVAPILQKDLLAIYTQSQRYPDIAPKIRDMIYDQYLKSHGIKEGLKSYSQIVSLALLWQDTYKRWL